MRIPLGLVLLLNNFALGFIDDLYCKSESCYDVLGVPKDAPRSVIAKAYRRLAQSIHPDRAKSDKERGELTEKFRRISTAYEILKDDKVRADYDTYLDDPSAYYSTYYRYYRRRLVPKLDIKIVIAGLITVATCVQHFIQQSNYDYTIRNLLSVPKYRHQAMVIAKEKGLINEEKPRKSKKASKNSVKSGEIDETLKQIIVDQIVGDQIKRPTWKSLLPVQIMLLPLEIGCFIVSSASWFIRHEILGIPLDDDEKLLVIRRRLGLNQQQFKMKYGHCLDELIELDLHERANFKTWLEQEQIEEERLLMQSGGAKRIQRWMKANAGSQIKFDSD